MNLGPPKIKLTNTTLTVCFTVSEFVDVALDKKQQKVKETLQDFNSVQQLLFMENIKNV